MTAARFSDVQTTRTLRDTFFGLQEAKYLLVLPGKFWNPTKQVLFQKNLCGKNEVFRLL